RPPRRRRPCWSRPHPARRGTPPGRGGVAAPARLLPGDGARTAPRRRRSLMAEGRRGLLIVGAAEVVTMAGRLRRGAAQDDPALVAGEDPIVAIWDESIAAVGPLAEVQRRLAADGRDIGSFAFLDAHGGTVTPG